MQKAAELDDTQNPLTRRLFLISPRQSFFERLKISQDHPASEVVGIITPRLPYETWFEGWRRAWRTKAKQDFLEDFRDLWSSPDGLEASISPEFVKELYNEEPADQLFDRWWTIREDFDLLEIDEAWRPS